MKIIILSLIPVFMIGISAEESTSSHVESKLINGNTPTNEPITYLASIRVGMCHMCNAFAISENLLLSAGDCSLFIRTYYRDYENVQAVPVNPDKTISSNGYPIIWTEEYSFVSKKHPNYLDNNDAGIFVIKKNLQDSKERLPIIPVELSCDDIPPGEEAKIFGWNERGNRGFNYNQLIEMTIRILPYEKCRKTYKQTKVEHFINSTVQICGVGKSTRQIATEFDLGSPLVYDHKIYGVFYSVAYLWNFPSPPILAFKGEVLNNWVKQKIADYPSFIPVKERKKHGI